VPGCRKLKGVGEMIAVRRVRDLGISCWMNDGGFIEGRRSIVLIHGSGRNHTIWRNQYECLQARFNIAALSLPGHSPSEGKGEKTVSSYSDWVIDAILAFGLTKPVLVGHSLGAAIALDCSLRYANLLSAIISVGGGAKMPVNPAILEGAIRDPSAAAALGVKFGLARGNRDRVGPLLISVLYRASPEVVHGDFLACDRFDMAQSLPSIGLPVLLICGTEDRLTPPANTESLGKAIPGSKIALIQGAGHFAMLEKVEEFNRVLLGFLEGIHGGDTGGG
jgi:pimeloyl-ACP methyl ester carboxylesterase